MPDDVQPAKESALTVFVRRVTTRPGVRASCLVVMVLTLCWMAVVGIDPPRYFREVLLLIGGSYLTTAAAKDVPASANPKES